MITAYFWKDNQVVLFDTLVYKNAVIKAGLIDCYCLDVSCDVRNTQGRYGKFHPIGAWLHTPLSEFPKEFKVHLLLLGVPL